MVRTNQGGSILGFIIIGAVLAALLIGGAYFVQHNLASVINEEPVAVNDDGAQQNPSAEEEPADKNKDESQPANGDGSAGQEGSQPAPTTPTPTTPAPSEPAHDDTTHTDSHQAVQPQNSSTSSLPQTGPGDILLAALLLSGVVGMLAAYLRSRALPSSL